jgi:hypothetical protein
VADVPSGLSLTPPIETKKKNTHSVIRFLRLKGTSPAEIHRQLVEVYGANVMSRKHVWVWCTAFDNGRTEGKVQQAVMSWLQALDTDFFYAGIDALVYWSDNCLGKYGDYVEK